jgi:hypothetical protein
LDAPPMATRHGDVTYAALQYDMIWRNFTPAKSAWS